MNTKTVWTAITNEIMGVFQYLPFIYCNYQTWQEQRAEKQEKTKEELAYRKHLEAIHLVLTKKKEACHRF